MLSGDKRDLTADKPRDYFSASTQSIQTSFRIPFTGLGPTRQTCATPPLRWGSGDPFPLGQQRSGPEDYRGLSPPLPPSALPQKVALWVGAATEWPYQERWSASSQPVEAWLSSRLGGCCLVSSFLNIYIKKIKIWGSFYQRIFNKTDHRILQAFLSTLKITPEFPCYFHCCNFPSHPKTKLAVGEEQRASVNAVFICCYCFSFINL